MQPPVAAPMPPPAPPKMVCMQCGVVETVTPVERDGAGSGAGAVAGAVLGGLSCTTAAMIVGGDVFKFALAGTIGGLILGLFASGIALMVIGFVRASKRKQK